MAEATVFFGPCFVCAMNVCANIPKLQFTKLISSWWAGVVLAKLIKVGMVCSLGELISRLSLLKLYGSGHSWKTSYKIR